MKDFTEVQPLSSDLSERTLALNLILMGPSDISIRSCEVLGRGFRNRTSFQNVKDISDVLVEHLALAIRRCLATVPDGAHVLSLPEFLVEVPGLALSGVHVLIMEVKDGVRNAIFRFKEFLGSVNNAFVESVGFQEPYASHAERLATNVLSEICIPLLNICRQMEFSQVGVNDRFASDMQDRLREFEFQTELLKRFIFNAGIGHARASQAYLQTDPAVFAVPQLE
jgi:hypothetical protein